MLIMRKAEYFLLVALALFLQIGAAAGVAIATEATEATEARADAVEIATVASPAIVQSDTKAATQSTPQMTIEDFHAGLLAIMKEATKLGIQGRIEKLAPLMERTFDLEFMASRTVGRHWRKLSDDDKKRWVEIFTRFTNANYAGRFTGFTGEEFVTIGTEDAPRDTRVVLTKIVIPNEDDVALNYRVIKRDGIWKVIDVFLNGTVSELALRRSEYSSTLKRDGFQPLINSIESKIEDLKKDGSADS